MGEKMEKKIDAKIACTICGVMVVCRPDKKSNLSWYNEGTDQKHFVYDPNTQKTSCRKPGQDTQPTSTVASANPTQTSTTAGTPPQTQPQPNSSSNTAIPETDLDQLMTKLLGDRSESFKKRFDLIWATERFVTKQLKQRDNKDPDKARVGMYVKMLVEHPKLVVLQQ